MIRKIVPYFLLLLGFASCEQKENLFPPDTLVVNRFEPLAALPNDTIFIYGNGFSEDAIGNVVEFTFPIGTTTLKSLATVIDADKNRLQVIVPVNILTGRVKIAVGPYSALSEVPFLLSPSISSVNPVGGLPNDQITIQGKNFPTDLTQLLLYIGDTRIDSIFGGSSTQIVFPLPEGLAPGLTTIRVGIQLTEEDFVFAPPADFTVFDPNQPFITSIEPNSNIPGAEITLKGNAFRIDGGVTTVTFSVEGQQFVVEETDFISLDNDEIKLKVPDNIDVEGKEQIESLVTVSVTPQDEPTLISEPFTFTILEPSDLIFFFTALNVPGASNTTDDFLYSAQPIPGITPSELGTSSLGVDVVGPIIYYANEGVTKINEAGESLGIINLLGESSASDIAINEAGNKVYYYNFDDGGLKVLNFSQNISSVLVFVQSIQHIKFHSNMVYWGARLGNGTGDISVTTDAGISSRIFLVPNADMGTNVISGLSVGQNLIYYVLGPTEPISATNKAGTSKIYAVKKDGTSSSATLLYTLAGIIVTDLEISADGTTLYWMESGESGAIKSAPAAGGSPTQAQTMVSSIRNGRYFDVLEKD